MKKIGLSLVLLLFVFMAVQALEPGEISPYLVGNNVWYAPISENHWDLAGQCGLQIIRIGGIAYDNNVPSISNLENWVAHIKAMGAEPMIQVSQYQSASAAADLVRHFNVTTKNPVKFWNIGNEPWLERNKPDLGTMAPIIAGYVKPLASAMKAIDPSIKIFAPDMCDFFGSVYSELLGTGGNSIAGKDGSGRYYVDGISWHRYVGGDLATSGASDFQTRIEACKKLIDSANSTHGRNGSNALGWGIGEFNSNGGAGVHTFANGQMFGQVYGHAMKNGATYVCTWSIFENGGSRGGTDFSFIDGITGKPRASYYHMQMYAMNFSGYNASTASSVSGIRVFAAKDTYRTSVMLINVNTGSYGVELNLNGSLPGSGTARISVDAGMQQSYSGQIGGSETQVLVFNNSGQLTKRITYNSRHFDMNPPAVENISTIPTPQPSPTPQPTPEPVITIPGIIEMENYVDFSDSTPGNEGGVYRSDDVDIEACGEGGYNVGWIEAGEWLAYNINVNKAGTYEVTLRVAKLDEANASSIQLLLDNAVLGNNIAIPVTGDWQAWSNVTDVISLPAGNHELKVNMTGSSFNINRITMATALQLPGDVNSDGSVTIIDALMTAQYYVGLTPSGFLASAADVNCDGIINIIDALMMAQYYVGLISRFC